MNVHIFTTGRGTPYGLATVPVMKVSSRTSLSERWSDLIDIDAGTIATGKASIEDVGKQISKWCSTSPADASKPGRSLGPAQ